MFYKFFPFFPENKIAPILYMIAISDRGNYLEQLKAPLGANAQLFPTLYTFPTFGSPSLHLSYTYG